MSSIAQMPDGAKSLAALEQAAADLRYFTDAEHKAVWRAIDAGASWRDLAWLVGEPLGTLYHRHRHRGQPKIGRAS